MDHWVLFLTEPRRTSGHAISSEELLRRCSLLAGGLPTRWLAAAEPGEGLLPPGSRLRLTSGPGLGEVLAAVMGYEGRLAVIQPRRLFRKTYRCLCSTGGSDRIAVLLDLDGNAPSSQVRWSIDESGRTHLFRSSATREHAGTSATRRLDELERALRAALLRLLQGGDGESVHDVRVRARTLRSLLDFMRPWTRRAPNRQARQILRDLARSLSDVRETDVLCARLKEAEEVGQLTTDAARALVTRLTQRRATSMEVFLDAMVDGTLPTRLDSLREALGALELDEDALARQGDETCLNEALNLQLRLDDHDFADVTATHELRKAAKRLRYVIESLGCPESLEGMEPRLKELQTRLGELCDARTNQQLLGRLSCSAGQTWCAELEHMAERQAADEHTLMEGLKTWRETRGLFEGA
ncbi:CHAD domain-containing protein [Olsenella sp. HMSC062G07]|uniref:CHAD domain-containing protein n=1 Tax=Olsenella sp. HMSC062G07 TaxID=1739330 RepID=UPI0008A13706|nr:CHAD domain-containing protein [Olsenella sp. HMSC062G07]OFK24387.1 hypothetical protein HMPREF2826_07270 [Olsenella sp. HMSC062G07]